MSKNFEFDSYKMRLISVNDIDAYYKYGFKESDKEAKYYTGTPDGYTKNQIYSYIQKISNTTSRYDFIISENDEIIGEVVLSDIEEKNCHYRICIFKKENFSKGIGYKATIKILEYAFDELNLESVDLEVFPFNERGISLYKKLGFRVENEIIDEDAQALYKKIIVMRLLKQNFNK
ncbi:hypothetical protein SANA_25640 [Gottschalkiaceae bacterium SANA]|nr:hypothetical protein SANA_25640 [Gottschalkiaceae bacterium SANA]